MTSDLRTVLVVEDNPATRRHLRTVIESAGLRVLDAAGGAEARAALDAERADLVLIDLTLPDVDPFELVADVRRRLGDLVPVLALTGLLARGVEHQIGAASFDDLIPKPIDATRLRWILTSHLEERARTTAAFGRGRRVLVADDDAVQRKMVAFRLGRLGFEVVTAADGDQALRIALEAPPDAVVTDVLMPKIDGFELCAKLRAEAAFSRTPIVLMTNSYLEESDRNLAHRAGADAFVVRTPEMRELTRSLEGLLRSGTHHEAPTAPTVQFERAERASRQLELQVVQNATLTQRSAILSAQLALLGGLAGALVENERADVAMDIALEACFDAGGIAWGALVVRSGTAWRVRALGLEPARASAIERHAEGIVRAARDAHGPSPIDPGTLFGTDAGGAALVAPLHRSPRRYGERDEAMGVLLLGGAGAFDEHGVAFAGVVAGQVALVLALARTFSELEAVSQAAHARAELLSSTLDAIGHPILAVDKDCVPVAWNRAGERVGFAGLRPPVEDWPVQRGLFHADETTLYHWREMPIVRALAGEAINGVEMSVRGPGATESKWISVTARPVRGADQRVTGAVIVARDVTLEKQAQSREIVSDRMASIGVLAAGIAHEINNPMTSVLTEIEMAIEDLPADSPVIEMLNSARDAAHRVTTIVRDLKTLSRGGTTDEVTVVDVRRVLDTATRLAAPETRPRAVVTIDIQDVPQVAANEARLVQVFLNLLVNAAQAMQPDTMGTIHIGARRAADGRAVVTMEDSGQGMTADVRARLFTPFFTTKPVGSGTGLGLSICNRIITSAGGTIAVESTPGRGSTFTIHLPAAPEHSRGSTPAPASVKRQVRVLVVDRDPFVRQTIVRALRGGSDVVALASQEVALARLAAGERFDCVVWGLGLDDPTAHASAAIQRVAEHVGTALVVPAPASRSGEVAALLGTRGRVVDKPIDPTIAALVREAIEHERGERP